MLALDHFGRSHDVVDHDIVVLDQRVGDVRHLRKRVHLLVEATQNKSTTLAKVETREQLRVAGKLKLDWRSTNMSARCWVVAGCQCGRCHGYLTVVDRGDDDGVLVHGSHARHHGVLQVGEAFSLPDPPS